VDISQYIKRDFKFRKSQFLSGLIVLIIVNTILTLLLFIAENFNFDLISLTSTNWIIQFLGNYFFLVVILSFIIGFFIFFNIFSELISSRKKEIGVIRAIGGLPELIKSVLLWEIIIISVLGVAIGIILGYLSYESFYFFMKSKYFILDNTPFWGLLLQIFLFIFLSWLCGGIQVNITYNKSIGKLLIDEVELEKKIVRPSKKKSRKLRFGLAYNFAKRSIKHHKIRSNRLFLNIFFGAILLSLAILGSFVFEQTITDNQKNAYGENMVVIGHKDVVFQYTSRMTLSNFHLRSSMNYTSDLYKINSTILSEFESVPYILIDPRFIIEYVIQEIPYTEGFSQTGYSRIVSSFIIGAHPERFIPNTNLANQLSFRLILLLSGPFFVITGDWLAKNLFSDVSQQNLILHTPQGFNPDSLPVYKPLGVCSDPINGGNVIYMNIRHLQDISKYDGHNLLLIKFFHPGSLIEIGNKIRELNNNGHEFIMLNSDWFLNNNIIYTQMVWTPFLIFPFILFGIIILNLNSHLNLSIKKQLSDYRILKALGTRFSTIKRAIFLQAIFESIIPYSFGVIIGTSIIFYLLYTQTFSLLMLFMISLAIFLAIFPIALISYLTVIKILKKKL